MTKRTGIPTIEWRSHTQTRQWTVSVAIAGSEIGATWKGPAVTEETARGHALRDVPRLLRTIAQLASQPLDPGVKPVIEMSSARLGETDDFRLAMLNAGSTALLDAAKARCAIAPSEADGIAAALLETLLAVGHSETDGIIHLSYGRLNAIGTDELPSLIFDTHVTPYRSQDLLVLDSWPEPLGAAVIATSVLHLISGGRHEDGQVRRDIPESATIRAQERYQARQQAPLNAPAIGALLRECGLPGDAIAFEKTFGLPQESA